jgi:hypothetical protein
VRQGGRHRPGELLPEVRVRPGQRRRHLRVARSPPSPARTAPLARLALTPTLSRKREREVTASRGRWSAGIRATSGRWA